MLIEYKKNKHNLTITYTVSGTTINIIMICKVEHRQESAVLRTEFGEHSVFYSITFIEVNWCSDTHENRDILLDCKIVAISEKITIIVQASFIKGI